MSWCRWLPLCNRCTAQTLIDCWELTKLVPVLIRDRWRLIGQINTEDDVEDNIAAGMRHGFPGVDDLLLKFIEECVVFLSLLLRLFTLLTTRFFGFHPLKY
jgi:hypothetical protein